MKLQVMPLLRVQRELYDIPLGRARFERYLDVMIGGSGDIVLPLGVMNPMRCSARRRLRRGTFRGRSATRRSPRGTRGLRGMMKAAERIREGACWTW
jgi:hypothetical protein